MGKKKEKVQYVDDGRSLADMSNVGPRRLPKRKKGVPSSNAKDIWNTYWDAVKMMITPMLVVVVALIIVYMVLWFLLTFFG